MEYNYESWIPGVPLVHFDTRGDRPSYQRVPCRSVSTPDSWFDATLSAAKCSGNGLPLQLKSGQRSSTGLRNAATGTSVL
ncbi:MAG: hypothetical protein MZV63_02935 [Marinilabiliales bacterium]|nr:hypothetical protein [Marinilabiliales bacterium]